MKKFITNLISQNHHHRALKLTLKLSSPSLTEQLYGHFVKSGHILDPFLSTTLITHFANHADFPRASRFLADTQFPDTVAFNALISGYAKSHYPSRCFGLLGELSRNALLPDKYTLSSLIKACDGLDEIEVVHVVCVKYGFSLSGFVASGLVSKYGKCGCVVSAERCFRECVELDDVVWTAMINGFVWNFEFEKGRELFVEMRVLGLGVNEFSLTAVVGALREVKDGEQIHGFGLKLGLVCGGSLHLSNVVMNMYSRFGRRGDACKVFDEIPDPDVVSWTARVGAVCDGGEALRVFEFMHLNGVEANEVTFVNLLSAIEGPRWLSGGRQVHSVCYKGGYLGVTSVGNALISMYGKCAEMGAARVVFDELVVGDTISWNSLIGGYSENSLVNFVFMVFSEMRDCGVQPDQYTLASVLGAVAGPDFADVVMQMHSYMIKIAFTLDSSMLSSLISSYGKCYSFDCAQRVLSAIEEINAGHLQVMAATAITAGCPMEALECFRFAMRLCSEMNGDIFSIVLKACSALTNLGQGRAIHCLALKSGFSSDRFVETATVDFYCKCGCIYDAENIFMDLCSHSLAAFNAMIMGYAQHGCYEKVLAMFGKMTELGVWPDEITYLGILQSCCHAGLVDEANIHFNFMSELHGLVPCLEHYASMVDLLGRVGLVNEAKSIIDKMPVSPDAQVWQSLLSACKNIGDLELGEVAARELLKLQPENDSAYILLSNLYARAHDWDAVRRLRLQMKEKSICKEPGSSWTEVGGAVSYFQADDVSNPENEKIYSYLQSLAQNMPSPLEMEEDCLACVAGL